MTKDQTAQDEINTLKERLADVEEKVAAMQTLFSTWLDGQVSVARQSMGRPHQVTPGPAVDEQVAFINARASERAALAKGRDATVKLGDADFDGAVDRINNKRKEAQGK